LQCRALSLELGGFLLFFEHNRLQLLAIVIELATLIFQDLSFLVHLDNCSFDHIDFVAKKFLRLQLLLSELALQGGHSTLVAHMVLNYRLPHGVKRKGRPPRTIKSICTHSQFCLRITPHLRTLIQPAHALTRCHEICEIIPRIRPLPIKTTTAAKPIFIKLTVFFNNLNFRFKIMRFVQIARNLGFWQICNGFFHLIDRGFWHILTGNFLLDLDFSSGALNNGMS
jgi:hypothetical protein